MQHLRDQIYELEILRLETQNFDSKVRVCKLKISSYYAQNFEFLNSSFEFVNSKHPKESIVI